MLKLQIIITIIIVAGVYFHVKKQNSSGGVHIAGLDPMAQSVHVESKDTFDTLKANLEASEQKSPEEIAEALFTEAMKSPQAAGKDQSDMMRRAKIQAEQMLNSGDVSEYRRALDKNTIMKRIIGE